MSTAYADNKRIIIPFICFYLFLTLISSSNIYYQEINNVALTDYSANNRALIYFPNSVIERKIKNLILRNGQIYDSSLFDFLSLEHKATVGNAKIFTLTIIKKINAKNKNLPLLGRELDAAVRDYYSDGNIVRKDIILDLQGFAIRIRTTNISNVPLVLYENELSKLIFAFKSDNLNISQGDLKSILNTKGGIVANYTNASEDILRERLNFLESKIEYQNMGVSVLFPFSFLPAVTNTNRIYFESDNPLLAGTFLKTMSVANTSAGQILGNFEIDNVNSFVFPTKLKGSCLLTKDQNRVISFGRFTYKKDNLTSSEISRMESLTSLCKDSIVPKLLNSRLVPTSTNSSITVNLLDSQSSIDIERASISYFKENIIYKIDLKNE